MTPNDRDPALNDQLRALPSVGEMLESVDVQELLAAHSRELVADALRAAVEDFRSRILAGRLDTVPSPQAIVDRAADLLTSALASRLRPVINATGVIVHTGLGRAPLALAALEAVRLAAAGYCNLEVRLEDGRRGRRDEIVENLLCRLMGAEAATVLNNNAAALLLMLRELAVGREVLVSRGQLIEIGGSFRLPEVMAQSGCVLREVGTTNRTWLSDYSEALDEATAAILVAHPSNYRVIGFHGEPELAELAKLAHAHGLPLLHDVGSGALVDLSCHGLSGEPLARDSLAAGADLVCFSADKLLGGPQAGVLVGRKDLVQRVRQNPLARALRVDKLCLAALEATLRLYLDEERARAEIPVLRALGEPLQQVRARAERLYTALLEILPPGAMAKVDDDVACVGGGSLPEQDLPSAVVRILPPEGMSADELARRLRTGDPSVYPRIAEGAVVIDLRAVRDDQVGELVMALAAAIGRQEASPAATEGE